MASNQTNGFVEKIGALYKTLTKWTLVSDAFTMNLYSIEFKCAKGFKMLK